MEYIETLVLVINFKIELKYKDLKLRSTFGIIIEINNDNKVNPKMSNFSISSTTLQPP